MTTAERLKGLAILAAKFMKTGEPAAPVTTPENFEAVKIKGGETMVEYSPSLEVGTPVMISSGTGSTPAKDETYTLENGVVFVVKDGKIESVTEDGKAKEEPKKEGEGDKGEYSQEAFDALVAENADLKVKFAELETTVAGFSEAFAKIPTAEQLVEFNANMKEVGSVILELSEIPVNVPVAVNPDAPVEQAVQFEKVAARFGKQD